MSKVRTVVATIVAMLCASVSFAQGSDAKLPSTNPASYLPQCCFNTFNSLNTGPQWATPEQGAMYVACWAEVPSNNAAYFSATFAGPAVNPVRKQFRTFVTTHYGPVSKVRCTGKFSKTVVTEQVEQWKDSARAAKNAIVDT